MSSNAKDAAGELAMLCALGVLVAWVLLIWIMGRIRRPLPDRVLVEGAVLIFACGVMGAILGPVFVAARPKATMMICLSNVKQIETAVMMYAADWDDTLPAATHWATLSDHYLKSEGPSSSLWHCPTAKSSYSYACNRALNGRKLSDLDELPATVDLFEADADTWNAGGGSADVAAGRHTGRSNYGFLDGHASSAANASHRWFPVPLRKLH